MYFIVWCIANSLAPESRAQGSPQRVSSYDGREILFSTHSPSYVRTTTEGIESAVAEEDASVVDSGRSLEQERLDEETLQYYQIRRSAGRKAH